MRQALQTEEVVRFKGKLPAGPNVETSDAVIIVEGRGDVLNLLKHGIKNAVAEGTNIPKEVIALTKEKTVTAFVDGDRGGEMIIQELSSSKLILLRAQITRSQFTQHKQIMKCLEIKLQQSCSWNKTSEHVETAVQVRRHVVQVQRKANQMTSLQKKQSLQN